MSERYIREGLLGKGRAGEVYLAKDSMLGRRVAVRHFPNHKLDVASLSDRWKEDFMALIAGLSGLSHPNLLRMIDGGMDKDGPYLVSAFVDGKSLSELTYDKEEKFDVVDAYELAEQVLDALRAAKQEGFFHYNLSPNSIIAQPRHTKGYTYILTDLGHSKLLPMIHGTEEAVAMLQYPALLAPEAFEGQPLGVKTTQFILGHLLYWMLAGGHPFAELTMADAYEQHKVGNIDSLSKYRPEIPKEFIQWLDRLMKPNPEERFSDLSEAMEVLPEAPKRIYSMKSKLPPKSISGEDLGW